MIAFYFASPDSVVPSSELTAVQALFMWAMVIFLFFVLPRLLFFLAGRRPHQSSETAARTDTPETPKGGEQ